MRKLKNKNMKPTVNNNHYLKTVLTLVGRNMTCWAMIPGVRTIIIGALLMGAVQTAWARGGGGFTPSVMDARPWYYIDDCAVSGTVVATLTVVDKDQTEGVYETLSYELLEDGAASEHFAVQQTASAKGARTVEISVKATQLSPFEVKMAYSLKLNVKDEANHSTNVSFKVYVRNQNDAPKAEAQTFTLAEAQTDGTPWAAGKTVGKVVATDPDGDQLYYSLKDAASLPFSIDPGDGSIYITDGSLLDYETKPNWTFKATAFDGELSTDFDVTVTLTDVNKAPVVGIVKQEYSIAENATTGTTVGSFTVTDVDMVSGAYEALTYTLTGALTGAAGVSTTLKNKSLADLFDVQETAIAAGVRTVAIKVKNQSLLDYEALYRTSAKNATYPATITVTDTKSHTVSFTTKIAVEDVNEKLTATGGTFYLNEHDPIGCGVFKETGMMNRGKVVGDDLDKYNKAFSTLTYKMSERNTGQSATDAAKFKVDPRTGEIRTNAAFDYETDNQSYTFLVTVTDGEFSSDTEVTVKLQNIAEKIPSYPSGTVEVKEGQDGRIYQFNPSDLPEEDQTKFDNLGDGITYEMEAGSSAEASGLFAVNDNGEIKVKEGVKLDYESLNSGSTEYDVVIIAKSSSDGSKSVSITKHITVTDVNEPPTITQYGPFNVAENCVGGGDVGTIVATDPDYCSTNSTYQCSNGSHPQGFNKLRYLVDKVIAVDGSMDFPFDLNDQTGKIKFRAGETLNYAKQKQYKFRVKVTDSSVNPNDPSRYATQDITINVTDVNRPSEFRTVGDCYVVDENVEIGTEVQGRLVVYDEDAADKDKLKITITDDNATTSLDASQLFEVVQVGTTSTDGKSTFVIKTKANLDYEKLYKATEKDAVFNITLTVTDTGGNQTSTTTKLRVNDVNEVPAFDHTPEAFSVSENTSRLTSLRPVQATDPDKFTPEFGTLTYSLEGDEAAPFYICPWDGEIFVTGRILLDYETKRQYAFNAVVTDGLNTVRVPVTVTVTNVKETPQFPKEVVLRVNENTLKGTMVGEVMATDDDRKNNLSAKAPTYSIVASDISEDDYKAFTYVDGVVKVASDNILNYEKQNVYIVRLVATDGDDTTLSSSVEALILVDDVNDPPTFAEKEYVLEVNENAEVGTVIAGGLVAADDEDWWSEFTYTLSDYETGSNDASAFRMDADGKVYVVTDQLNFEKKKQYQFWAKATDNGESRGFNNLTATTLVTVNLIDMPDAPVFSGVDDSYAVEEGTAVGTQLTSNIEVTDEDKGQIATLTVSLADQNTDAAVKAEDLFEAFIQKGGDKYMYAINVKSELDYFALFAANGQEPVSHVTLTITDDDNKTTTAETTIRVTGLKAEVNFAEGQTWKTFYNLAARRYLIPDGVKAYIVTGVSGTAVTLTQVNYIMPNVPLLLEKSEGATNTLTSLNFPSVNLLKYASESLIVPVDGKLFILYNGTFVKATAGTDLNGKCYLDLTDIHLSNPVRALSIGSETTAIDHSVLMTDDEAGTWYDLQGRRIVKPTSKGIYIKDGKKVIIK